MDGLQLAVKELERIYKRLLPLFERENMSQPVITIQSRGRKQAVGWFSANRWEDASEIFHCEINFCAESLARDVVDIATTMVHEMVHQSNFLDGIRDVSGNQHHNRVFMLRCLDVGLICEKGKRGWSTTTAGPELKAKILALKINGQAFSLFRTTNEPKKKKSNNLRKWKCDCSAFWSKKDIAATCDQCGQQFEEQKKKATEEEELQLVG